ARPDGVGNESLETDLDRLLISGYLDRLGSHICIDVRFAIEAVRKRTPAPGRAREIDVDEGLAVREIAADRYASIAAVGAGEHLVRQHFCQGAKHGIDHAEAGEAPRSASGR